MGADVAHVCLKREAGGIQRKADHKVDGKRIAGPGPDRVGGQRHGGRRVAGIQRGDHKVRVAHKAVPILAGCARHAGLQIMRGAVEVITCVADAAAKGREDREVRTSARDDFVRSVVTPGDVEWRPVAGCLETE
jgi:hypothetical protein